jgi:hypothetical protein
VPRLPFAYSWAAVLLLTVFPVAGLKPGAGSVDSHGWISIERTWSQGDRIVVSFSPSLRLAGMGTGNAWPSALVDGPAFRQADRKQRNPARELSPKNSEMSLVSEPGGGPTFHLKADANMLVRPFYDFKEGEPYFLYLDPAAEGRFSHRDATFNPQWNDAVAHRFTNVVGATAEFTFDGTGIRWLGWRFDDAGRGEVRMDDKVAGIVDQYGPGRGLPFECKTTGLTAGRHTIQILLLSDKNPASSDRYLNVAGFQVFP